MRFGMSFGLIVGLIFYNGPHTERCETRRSTDGTQ